MKAPTLGWLAVLAALTVAAPAAPQEEPTSPLRVQLDKSKVDLKQHKLELKMSRPAGTVRIKVYADSGVVLAEEEHDYTGKRPGALIVVAWTPSSDEAVGKIELYAYDIEGYFVGFELVPWSVAVPHEEVSFAYDSAEIADEEKPKLEDSFVKITETLAAHKELGKIVLFIAGHTDTMGPAAYNRQLSNRRAQAIAQWFRQRGLTVPIAYEGFGEHALLVKTADEVEEPRNRRVDYILSVEDPAIKTMRFRPAWKRIP